MPGFADPADQQDKSTVIGADSRVTLPLENAIGGFPSIDTVGDRTFYGIKLNAQNGRLTFEQINADDGVVVDLPKTNILRDNDYKVWVWTTSLLNLEWNSPTGDHLYMEVN